MNQELYLKTIFCCMTSDGEVAAEEVNLIKSITDASNLFSNLNLQSLIEKYVQEFNSSSKDFLMNYLSELEKTSLDKEEELKLIELAIKTIESDNVVKYSEIKFFKLVRKKLSLTDEEILKVYPDKEEFLLPDAKHFDFSELENVKIGNIDLDY